MTEASLLIDEPTAQAIAQGQHGDPFSVLGLHEVDGKLVMRAMRPEADSVEVIDAKTGRTLVALDRVHDGLFAGVIPRRKKRFAYRLRMTRGSDVWEEQDAYAFGAKLGEMDEYLLGEGTHNQLWDALGAHVCTHEGVEGTHFAVWAPNAARVSVVGDFNGWDGRRHVMRRRGATGVHEIFLPGLGDGTVYKYEILDSAHQLLPLKADPVGFGAELPPATASVVRDLRGYEWSDAGWLSKRGAKQKIDQPISIYEVHLESWRRVPEEGNRSLTYLEHASMLVDYAKDMGFTHIELTPISEYPFGGSWGYQPVGLFAPTSRFGAPQEFRAFVDACHKAGLGVIIDWVPGHFPTDQHGLGRFDGSALYEHADPKEGFHPDWNTLVYNYGRTEVQNFLIANAKFWFEEYHIDGLRVDAVASMLYRDYSRKEGEWVPNQHGGRENLEAIAFMQHMNEVVYAADDSILTAAEESTAFPGVSAPTSSGGLGFGFKWNMGWMNDTLRYMAEDPINRKYHHDKMTFGLHYAFSENFILPLSHDEVVHGKGSLLGKMPGDDWQRFANLRAYYGFMWGHPGKKLLFMGGEFAQSEEWNNESSLDWHLLEYGPHQGMQSLVRDLNTLYRATPALYEKDASQDGFRWIDGGNAADSVFSWVRYGKDGSAPVLVVSNFTPVPRTGFRIGVPQAGHWTEKLNTDASLYGGTDTGTPGGAHSEDISMHGCPYSIEITVPPLATVFFELTLG
ncbi:1,4-alpha-glucan branching protein GlgB [Marivita geojedonensis]|uniref:1,4-alpha-glucan branching enzyme GlgB n=1 Tax=Marivita geojedonensis TaxID=1123756 RepID=A0A1X4NQ57_9RHOB|nr:1,4-alpha-glucan branching protein GlgB [Marivita geojedonensis]OSQ53063.1 glycogen branching protein [Marivita geojedonensis]PRY82021.1 1,4-alpha-glucan branching enzyme [Marivita geojedonensis]